jgi:DNA-binding transcriptional LysR family regulator
MPSNAEVVLNYSAEGIDMDQQQLEYFQVVGRLQNVSRAAERLAMTQPALSRSIDRLERELGVALLERVGRGVRLTRHGEAFLPHAERALAALADGRRELDDLSGTAARRVSLGFLHTLGPEYVPELIRAFKLEHPEIRFDFSQNGTGVLDRQLEGGELDLCLTSGPRPNPLVAWARLLEEDVFLIVPAGHRLANAGAVRLGEVADEPFVAFKTGLAMRELSDELCRQAGFAPQITFESEEPITVGGFVAAGLGVGLIPSVAPATPGVVRLHITEPLARRSVGIAWRSDRYLTTAARALRDFAIASAARR